MLESRFTIVGIAILLVVVTVAAYFEVVFFDFVQYDDPIYVCSNPHVLAGLSWDGWSYAWTTLDCSNWHPVTWLSLEVDGSLWGRNPAGYHAVNVLLHASNAVLLFLVLLRMTGRLARSSLVAMLFAVHPLHVESVAWISERKDVLSTAFLLLTLMAYVHYASRPSWGRYFAVVTMFTVGLLAKPMLVTLPILLLLIDVWPLNRISWTEKNSDDSRFPSQPMSMLVREKVPMLVLAFFDGMATIVAQGNAMNSLIDSSLDLRLVHMFHAFFWYLLKTFDPRNLAVFYPHPERALSWSQIILGVTSVFVISVFVLWHRRAKPYLIVGWAWFIAALMPVIGLLQVGGQAYADRYSYVPHIGLFVLIVWGLCDLAAAIKFGRVILGLVSAMAILACFVLTHSQVSYWKNDEVLWTHVLAIMPDNFLAHIHLAHWRNVESDHERTIEHIRRSLRSKEGARYAKSYCLAGKALVALNRSDEAEMQFLQALKLEPKNEDALEELSKLLRQQNRQAEFNAVSMRYAEVLRRICENFPNDAVKQLNLGLVLFRLGKFSEAIPHLERATRLDPQSAAALNNLALVLLYVDRREEAKSIFRRALELNPRLATAHFNLADILDYEKDYDGAKEHFAEALKLNPDDVEAAQRLNRLTKQQAE